MECTRVEEAASYVIDLDARSLAEFRKLVTIVAVPAGTVLGREGAVVRELILLLEGRVVVTVGGEPVGIMSPGSNGGLPARPNRPQPRHRAGFRTLDSCYVAAFNRREFATLVRLGPSVEERLTAGAMPSSWRRHGVPVTSI